jgi:heterodisulfide reductase subunit B
MPLNLRLEDDEAPEVMKALFEHLGRMSDAMKRDVKKVVVLEPRLRKTERVLERFTAMGVRPE